MVKNWTTTQRAREKDAAALENGEEPCCATMAISMGTVFCERAEVAEEAIEEKRKKSCIRD